MPASQQSKLLPQNPRVHRTAFGWERRETSPYQCLDKRQARPKPKSLADTATAESFLTLLSERLKVVSVESENKRLQRENQERAIDILNRIVALTSRKFGEHVKVYESCDPEFPDDRYTVFEVESSLDSDALLAAEREWISEMAQIAPQCDTIRLLLSPV